MPDSEEDETAPAKTELVKLQDSEDEMADQALGGEGKGGMHLAVSDQRPIHDDGVIGDAWLLVAAVHHGELVVLHVHVLKAAFRHPRRSQDAAQHLP